MANITTEINDINNAVYGKQVRPAISSGLTKVNNDVITVTAKEATLESQFNSLVINAGSSNAEVVTARTDSNTGVTYATLGARLNDFPIAQALTTGTDLNNIKKPGLYTCPSDAVAVTLLNCPTSISFSMTVEKAATTGVKQSITEYVTVLPKTYNRNFYSTWGVWYNKDNDIKFLNTVKSVTKYRDVYNATVTVATTGTIKINLPSVLGYWIKIKLDVMRTITNIGIWDAEILIALTSSHVPSGTIKISESSSVGVNLPIIRLAWDTVNARFCILIGDINTVNSPGQSITISEVTAFTGVMGFDTGWTFEIITDESTLSSITQPMNKVETLPKIYRYHPNPSFSPNDTYTYTDLATFYTDTGVAGVTNGTIKITMPKSWTASIFSMTIRFLSYPGANDWELKLTGYLSTAWANLSAYANGNPNLTSIRVGYDGTKLCILLGTTASTWRYHKVSIDKFETRYLGVADWDKGWDMSLITDESTITNIVTVPFISGVNYTPQVLTTQNYTKFPNGLIMQWGKVTLTPTATNQLLSKLVTLPIAYPTAIISAQANLSTDTPIDGNGHCALLTNSSITVFMQQTSTVARDIHWMTIGY